MGDQEESSPRPEPVSTKPRIVRCKLLPLAPCSPKDGAWITGLAQSLSPQATTDPDVLGAGEWI